MMKHSMTFGAQIEDPMSRVNGEQGLTAVSVQLSQRFGRLLCWRSRDLRLSSDTGLILHPVPRFLELIGRQGKPCVRVFLDSVERPELNSGPGCSHIRRSFSEISLGFIVRNINRLHYMLGSVISPHNPTDHGDNWGS